MLTRTAFAAALVLAALTGAAQQAPKQPTGDPLHAWVVTKTPAALEA